MQAEILYLRRIKNSATEPQTENILKRINIPELVIIDIKK